MNKKPEVIICYCTGSCPSMVNIDVWDLANYIRLELPVEYTAIHPMLCAQEDGHAFLKKLLKPDGVYITMACDSEMEQKLFGQIFSELGLERGKQWFPLNIKKKTTEEAMRAIQQEVERALNPQPAQKEKEG